MNTVSTSKQKSPRNELVKKMLKYKFLYLIAAPAILLVFVFCYLPMGGLVIAFQDYDIIGGILGSKFIGFDNFVQIFTIPKFIKAIGNTLKYSSV